MTKADFLKAARAAAPHVTAQIEWLEDQEYGDYDQAWLKALEVLETERSALYEKIEDCKAKGSEFEQEGGQILAAYWVIEGNAFDTARDEGWDMDQLENQVRVLEMATNMESIRIQLAAQAA